MVLWFYEKVGGVRWESVLGQGRMRSSSNTGIYEPYFLRLFPFLTQPFICPFTPFLHSHRNKKILISYWRFGAYLHWFWKFYCEWLKDQIPPCLVSQDCSPQKQKETHSFTHKHALTHTRTHTQYKTPNKRFLKYLLILWKNLKINKWQGRNTFFKQDFQTDFSVKWT